MTKKKNNVFQIIKASDLGLLKPHWFNYLTGVLALIITVILWAISFENVKTVQCFIEKIKDVGVWLPSLLVTIAFFCFSYSINVVGFFRAAQKTKRDINFRSIYTAIVQLVRQVNVFKELKWENEKEGIPKPTADVIKGLLEQTQRSIEHPLPSPEVITPYLQQFEALAAEDGKIVSIWASSPALWQNPTAIYYITMNGLVSLRNYLRVSKKYKVDFSSNQIDIEGFETELSEIIKNTRANYSLRFLVFDDKTYNEYEENIDVLIQLHHYFRMHCLPIVRGKIEGHNLEIIKKFKNEFENKTGKEPPFEFLPDLTIIENFQEWRAPRVGELRTAMWIVGIDDPFYEDTYKDAVDLGKDLLKTLLNYYDNLRWESYGRPNKIVIAR